MIKEVAIEPEVMATWQHFRDLWDDLGAHRGRLVAEYPPDWREKVVKLAFTMSTAKAGRIMACLKPGPGQSGLRRWVPTDRAYPAGNPNDKGHWLKCAESHESPGAFDAIVAAANPRNAGNVLVAGDYLKSHARWATDSQLEVPRTAADLLKCAQFLLRNSNELVMVEPNFDASEERFRKTVETLVGCRAKGNPWRRLELHVKCPMDRDGKWFPAAVPNRMANAKAKLAPLIPAGNTLRLFFWQRKTGGKRIHPRFLFTELGGLQPDFGLDEGDAEGDTTIVSLMGENIWESVRGDFCEAGTTFHGEACWRCDIVGQKI